jgi:hypothetical protein
MTPPMNDATPSSNFEIRALGLTPRLSIDRLFDSFYA